MVSAHSDQTTDSDRDRDRDKPDIQPHAPHRPSYGTILSPITVSCSVVCQVSEHGASRC